MGIIITIGIIGEVGGVTPGYIGGAGGGGGIGLTATRRDK